MNRNQNSRFALNPVRMDMERTKFPRHASYKTTFKVGDCIPFYLEEVLPGDSFNVKTSKVVRMQPLVTPIMDNIYLDTYYFFVPNRLTWNHWREFMGENTSSAWVQKIEYEVPQLTAPEGGWNIGTLADYFGIPTGIDGLSVNALPFRAYSLIMNEFFRDQNLSDPINVPVDDTTVVGVNTGNYITDVAKGGLPFVASKYHDYFTSALPAPLKAPAEITIPVAEAGKYAVFAAADDNDFDVAPVDEDGNLYGLRWGSNYSEYTDYRYHVVTTNADNWPGSSTVPLGSLVKSDVTPSSSGYGIYPTNLIAMSTGNAQAATINQLRLAFQIQKFYERNARGGTRYIELLKSHFGVTSPDARLQRPEYLGGNRIPININQIVQQSATGTGTTPQGNPVGLSQTVDKDDSFVKSFVEHGYVIGIMVARYDHTYQQGLDRMWSRKSLFDFYFPAFAHIGEQAILNQEIYAQGTDEDTEVFGYQEAWADYRYKPSRVTGEMRSQYAQSLDVWHLADDYSTLPTLSDEWIREDGSVIDRVMAVSSEVSAPFFADIYIENWCTRVMPLYSIPGLIDHF